jgi:hypothetical protein
MMRKTTPIQLTILLLTVGVFQMGFVSASFAQMDIFSGRGISSSQTNSSIPSRIESQSSKSTWPGKFDFSNGGASRLFKTEDRENPFSKLFSSDKKFTFPKFGNGERKPFSFKPIENPFPSLDSLIPKRDPATPNFLQRLNAKSKDLVDRTTDWAQRQNDTLRSRTTDSWDSITRGGSRTPRPDASYSPATPPIRTAETPSGSRIRF